MKWAAVIIDCKLSKGFGKAVAIAQCIVEADQEIKQLEADIAVYKKLDVVAGVIITDLEAENDKLREHIRRIGVQTEIPLAVFSRDRALRCLKATRDEVKAALEAGGER